MVALFCGGAQLSVMLLHKDLCLIVLSVVPCRASFVSDSGNAMWSSKCGFQFSG